MRGRRYRLYPLVSAGRGQPRYPKLAACSDRPEPRRDAQPNCARLAAAAFPRHAANPRDLLDSASRGESRLRVDSLELRRVSRACFSLIATTLAPDQVTIGALKGSLCDQKGVAFLLRDVLRRF